MDEVVSILFENHMVVLALHFGRNSPQLHNGKVDLFEGLISASSRRTILLSRFIRATNEFVEPGIVVAKENLRHLQIEPVSVLP